MRYKPYTVLVLNKDGSFSVHYKPNNKLLGCLFQLEDGQWVMEFEPPCQGAWAGHVLKCISEHLEFLNDSFEGLENGNVKSADTNVV